MAEEDDNLNDASAEGDSPDESSSSGPYNSASKNDWAENGMSSSAEAESAPGSSNSNDSDFSDILGQDDIDSLLQQVSGESEEDEGIGGEESEGHVPGIIFAYPNGGKNGPPRIDSYDFRHPAFLGEMEMRRLRLMHEDFIRFLEARITLYLRSDFSLKMTHLSTKSYEHTISEVENPTHLALFRVSPLPGVGFIEMSPNIALTIASSILGGKGHAPRIERYLTQIEIDLIEEFLTVVLEEWARRWESKEDTLEPSIIGHEIVANVLQICEHDTVMFSLMMDASLRGAIGRLGISVPLHMIEEPVRELNVKPGGNELKKERKAMTWRSTFAEIVLTAEASFSLGQYRVEDALGWQVGTILPFEESALEEVTLKLADIPLFQVRAGIEEENRAVQIQGGIKKETPIWQMKK